jgi:methionyl-tRNA synthetase
MSESTSEKRQRYLVTSALPYANGPLHVGQIVGAYLPADAFVRYLRARGEDVVYVCGTDEHGVPITLTAEREGKDPQDVVDYWWAHMKETFERFGIGFDNFSRTSTPLHAKNTQLFYRKLKEGGYISEAESKQMYSPTEGRFLPDRYVEGTCPVCGYKEARGDQCDNCGSWYEAFELIEPHSKVTGGPAEVRETTHLYLDLPKFSDRLRSTSPGRSTGAPPSRTLSSASSTAGWRSARSRATSSGACPSPSPASRRNASTYGSTPASATSPRRWSGPRTPATRTAGASTGRSRTRGLSTL